MIMKIMLVVVLLKVVCLFQPSYFYHVHNEGGLLISKSLLTNTMEPIPPPEADRSSDRQETPGTSWNSKADYDVCNGSSFVPILNQARRVFTF